MIVNRVAAQIFVSFPSFEPKKSEQIKTRLEAESKATKPAQEQEQGAKVLIVDDEFHIREIISEILNQRGLGVETASGEEGLQKLRVFIQNLI